MSEKHQVKCKANGCHDRYNCQLYDMSAEPNGVIHIIPLNHKPGDEQCFMYTPKENLSKNERERQLLKDFYSDVMNPIQHMSCDKPLSPPTSDLIGKIADEAYHTK